MDTRGIKQFVDKRRYLPEIRYASKVLEEAVEAALKQIGDSIQGTEVIYEGGGNALLVTPSPIDEKQKS